jgi:tRNA-dihydrouridine synthase C
MRVLLAPMEGVLDSLVRELLTEVNDYDLCVTEFCAWSICCCR